MNQSLTTVEIHPALSLLESDLQELGVEKGEVTRTDVGTSFYQLGKIYYDKADLDKAEEAFEKSLQLFDPLKDGFSILKAYGFLIRIASEKLEDQKAQKCIEESEKLIDLLGRHLPTLNAEYFYNLGVVKNYSGQFEEARKNLNWPLQNHRKKTIRNFYRSVYFRLRRMPFTARTPIFLFATSINSTIYLKL